MTLGWELSGQDRPAKHALRTKTAKAISDISSWLNPSLMLAFWNSPTRSSGVSVTTVENSRVSQQKTRSKKCHKLQLLLDQQNAYERYLNFSAPSADAPRSKKMGKSLVVVVPSQPR